MFNRKYKEAMRILEEHIEDVKRSHDKCVRDCIYGLETASDNSWGELLKYKAMLSTLTELRHQIREKLGTI